MLKRKTFNVRSAKSDRWKGSMSRTIKHEEKLPYDKKVNMNFSLSNKSKTDLKNFIEHKNTYSDLYSKVQTQTSEITKMRHEVLRFKNMMNTIDVNSKKFAKFEKKILEKNQEIDKLGITLEKMISNAQKEKEKYKNLKKEIDNFEIVRTSTANKGQKIDLPYSLDGLIADSSGKEPMITSKILEDFSEGKRDFTGSVITLHETMNSVVKNIFEDTSNLKKQSAPKEFKSRAVLIKKYMDDALEIDKLVSHKFTEKAICGIVKEGFVIATRTGKSDYVFKFTNTDEMYWTFSSEEYKLEDFGIDEDKKTLEQIENSCLLSFLKSLIDAWENYQGSIARKIYYDLVEKEKGFVISDGCYFHTSWKPGESLPATYPLGLNKENYTENWKVKSFFLDIMIKKKSRNEVMKLITNDLELNVVNSLKPNRNNAFLNSLKSDENKMKDIANKIKNFGELFAVTKFPHKLLKSGESKKTKINIVKNSLTSSGVEFKKARTEEVEVLAHDKISIGSIINFFSDAFCYGFASKIKNFEIQITIDNKRLPLLFYNKYARNLIKSFKSTCDYSEHYKTFMMWTRLCELIGSLRSREMMNRKSKKNKEDISTMKNYIDGRLTIDNLTRFSYKNDKEDFSIDIFKSLSERYSNGKLFGRPDEHTRDLMIACILEGSTGSDLTNYIVEYIKNN